MVFRIVVALLAAMALAGCVSFRAAPASEPGALPGAKTVYVTRHLHKAIGNDPPLSAQGAAAAETLARALAGKGIAAIFATPTRRAMQTAEPLSRRTGLAITPYDPRNPQGLAETVAGIDGSVLVVGHSNTVPELVTRFGGTSIPPLSEEDYGTVFAINADSAVTSFEIE